MAPWLPVRMVQARTEKSITIGEIMTMSLPLPKPRYQPRKREKPAVEEEKRLRAIEGVGGYLDFALQSRRRRHWFLRELFRLKQQMTPELFMKAIQRAHTYRVKDIQTIRSIVRLFLLQGDGPLPSPQVDEAYLKREAYLEGKLTDEPDFTPYDTLLEDDHE